MTVPGSSNLTPLDLAFGGDWVAPGDANLSWRGEVRGDRPFAALITAKLGGRLLWAKSEILQPPAPVVLHLHPLRAPTQTQVILTVGDGVLQELVATLPCHLDSVRAVLPERAAGGVVLSAFLLQSEPAASLNVLFLAREDVRKGRTGVWRPRAAVDAMFPLYMKVPLLGGRKGAV